MDRPTKPSGRHAVRLRWDEIITRLSYRFNFLAIRVRAEDLALGGPQMQAYPMAPDGTVRSDSRLNLVILARFDPAALTDETRTRAADGVVAYSAICTHQGCPVNAWSNERSAFVCSCHGAIYDPSNTAEEMGGPAPRPLAALSLKFMHASVRDALPFPCHFSSTHY